MYRINNRYIFYITTISMQNIKATIDIWNSYIKGIVIGHEDGKDTILAREHIKTQWYRKGKILDAQSLTKSIQGVIEWFQKKLGGEYIDDVVIGISHPEMLIERITESKRILWSDIITNQDIVHLSKLINDMSHKSNFEILKILPVYWTLDDDKVEKNPEWLQAKKLSLTADIFCIPKVFYQNITEIFSWLWLNVVDIVPNILAAAESLLDTDHKDLGTMLIDIGANQTSFVVYEEWYPLSYGVIPVGGDEVSKDISIGMQIDIKEAEKYKLASEQENEEETLDQRFLDEIITARYEQVLEKIHDKLIAIDKDGRLAWWIYLTGQWSGRHKTLPLTKHIFKLATFYAKDQSGHYGEIANNPLYHNCIWLHAWSKKYHNSKSLFSFRNVQSMGKWLWESISNFFKDLF